MVEYVLLLLLIIILCLICALIAQRNDYLEKLNSYEEQQIEIDNKCSQYAKENKELTTKNSVYFTENANLKEMLSRYEEDEYNRLGCYKTCKGDLIKEPIYEGKKALIGDYMVTSYTNTKKVLQSLGFTVDVEKRQDDVINRISYGNDYDIIFTNNVYPDGSGPDLLKELKSYEGFSTPVVIHTISKNQREYFEDYLGFDGYIEKPVSPDDLKPILEKIFKK